MEVNFDADSHTSDVKYVDSNDNRDMSVQPHRNNDGSVNSSTAMYKLFRLVAVAMPTISFVSASLTT